MAARLLCDSDWFAGLVEQMGAREGTASFSEILPRPTGFRCAKVTHCSTNLISAGEVPLGLTIFNYTAEQFKKKGAPIDWFTLDPLVAHPNAIAVAANAPHPNAAVLLFDFILSDAQKLFADRDYVVTDTKVSSPLDRGKMHILDASKVVAEGEKWQRLYTQIITSKK